MHRKRGYISYLKEQAWQTGCMCDWCCKTRRRLANQVLHRGSLIGQGKLKDYPTLRERPSVASKLRQYITSGPGGQFILQQRILRERISQAQEQSPASLEAQRRMDAAFVQNLDDLLLKVFQL